ncbi:MAG TPA: XdhC family protein [Gemmataceae bacterium]|nr:XdhC family protein [Gemmataceae bacterium]
MRDLLAELTTALEARRECVYCSVVETRGSTPQKAGAAMLVFPDGSQRGTLGGGCVEAEVKQRALRVLAGPERQHQEPDCAVLTFCLDDNYGWDDGLICGGRMSILADPLRAAGAADYYRRFRELIDAGRGCTEAVVLGAASGVPVGSRYLFDGAGQPAASLADGPVPDLIARHLKPLADRPGPATRDGVAFLPILPRVTLLIVGGGHVGRAVARLAAEVDFDVWVMDDRAAYASRERFPDAERLVAGEIGPTLKELVAAGVGPSTYCLIVTRGHNHDEEALYHLATTAAGYVGMIGSRRKIRLIFEDLVAKGVPAEALAKVHAPLGFDIGSQTVPEIAVSIVAELIARRNLGESAPRPRVRVQAGTSSPLSPGGRGVGGEGDGPR